MRPALLLFGGLFTAGCAVSPTNDTPDADTGSQTATALVVVERASGPGDALREAVVARFVRSRSGALDETTLRAVGLVQDLPAPGVCAALPGTLEGSSSTVLPVGRTLDLLDVGPLAVEGPQSRAVLLPRAMPDPAGLVSGVFYSARSAEALSPGSRFALRAAGGADLDGFTVGVAAPLDVEAVRATVVERGLEVSWDAPASDARDVFYVDVLAPAPRVVARCTVDAGSRFVVPSVLLGLLGATPGANEDGQVAVHRVRREAFRAKGIEPGEVRFDVARVVAFRR